MKAIKLTPIEAAALRATADQMKDDFTDYYSYLPKRDLKKFHNAYISGMNKLLTFLNMPNKK